MAGKRKRTEPRSDRSRNVTLETRVVVESWWVTPTAEFCSSEALSTHQLFKKIKQHHNIARAKWLYPGQIFAAPVFYLQEIRPRMKSKWFKVRLDQTIRYIAWFNTCINSGEFNAEKLKVEVHLRCEQTAIADFKARQAGDWGFTRYMSTAEKTGEEDQELPRVKADLEEEEFLETADGEEDDDRKWEEMVEDDVREAPSTEEWFPELVADPDEATTMTTTKPQPKQDTKPATRLETHEETQERHIAQARKRDWSDQFPADEEDEQLMITSFEKLIEGAAGDYEKMLYTMEYVTWTEQVEAWKKGKKAATS